MRVQFSHAPQRSGLPQFIFGAMMQLVASSPMSGHAGSSPACACSLSADHMPPSAHAVVVHRRTTVSSNLTALTNLMAEIEGCTTVEKISGGLSNTIANNATRSLSDSAAIKRPNVGGCYRKAQRAGCKPAMSNSLTDSERVALDL